MIQNHLLSSSFFFFFVFVYSLTIFITLCSSVNPNFEACKATSCINQIIKYPFYILGRQRSFCGFPGFGLICSDNDFPILNISNYQYVIHEISYTTQSIQVSEAVISSPNATSSSCAIPHIHNITLDGTRFSFHPNQSDLFLLFGCNLGLLPGNFSKYKVGCSAENETISVLGMTADGGDLRYASEKCNGSVVVETKIGNETKEGEINGDVVRRGFVLNWVVASCNLCEETGGKCGFDSSKTDFSFKCYCPDRDHALRCDPPVPAPPPGSKCPTSFDCGYLGKIQFPWTTTELRDCGLFVIQGCGDPSVPKNLLTNNGTTRTFKVFNITHTVSSSESTIVIRDMDLQERLRNRSCKAFSSNYTLPLTFPPPTLASVNIRNIGFFLRCNRSNPLAQTNASFFNFTCFDSDIIYGLANPERNRSSRLLSSCSVIRFPFKDLPDDDDPFTFITSMVVLQVRLSDNCSECLYKSAGRCQLDPNGIFNCDGAPAAGDGSRVLKLGLGIGLGIGLLAILMIAWLIRRWCYRRKHGSYDDDQFETGNSYSADYSISEPENGNIYLGVPLFSYKQLQEATNNFDQARELGDGGFGIVYYGKLRDGREVAVKHLYEHNYRKVEQFRNEVEILARLRHKNLVSLYGCTSRRSQDLLLVYEYISNGTVASHLQGNNNNSSTFTPLTWPIRLKIAIETASALVYLHASDIIHRDVKTNNILVDNNFNVKVADFGLSRLFPNDVSHVSTAPQGTPGYVDPEYYQCYQLTSKSDVYSFGVVLIELISSKPAVDTSRSKDEVNLSSLAMKKIQESAFMELVDPCLGIEDSEVKRMVVSVGELAFQCLQRDKDLRPSMEEVLEALKRIQSGDDEVENLEGGDKPLPPSPPSMSPGKEEAGLLKKVNPPPFSPNTVTDKWTSESSTPNVSG